MKKTLPNKKEYIIGAIVLVAYLLFGAFGLGSSMLFFRMLVGLSFGYALARGAFGFAGSTNRASRTGSTKLMRSLMWMVTVTAIATTGFVVFSDSTEWSLWINPINFGLLIGGLFFGCGMAFSSCCATGVLTDVIEGPSRGLITLLFFGLGVFLGFPLQATKSWITTSWFNSTSYSNGVYLPDLFKWDGLNGYVGAIIFTIICASIVVIFARRYEQKRKDNNTYTGVVTEVEDVQNVPTNYKFFSMENYQKLFIDTWSLRKAATMIVITFVVLMAVSKAGWGASTPYGFWFARILHLFGANVDTLAAFMHKPANLITDPFFSIAINVQNFSIIMGTIICALLQGRLLATLKAGFTITLKELLLFAAGGLLMGLGTRFANGCNVGAFYTPIANLSLSGWIYVIFLFSGGFLGNIIWKKVYNRK